jgi:hypothetical protein
LIIASAIVVVVALLMGRHLVVSVGSIKAELKPNGGSSMRDAIDRMEAATKVNAHRAEIAATSATLAAAKANDAAISAAASLEHIMSRPDFPQQVNVDIRSAEG